MTTENHEAVLRPLRTLWSVGAVRELGDGQLLERFATSRGEGAELAFAELVERHGGMVFSVCRSVLSHRHDAQDAFQATFLVLVKKARSLWVRDSLGPWLHQVAYRTALCVRASAARRQRLEARCARPVHDCAPASGDELRLALHEAIERLPERYRAPLVLCDLEGCTHEQAARHLGWPIGTVKSRQARARQHLRQALTPRGLAPSAVLLAGQSWRDRSAVFLDQTVVVSTTKVAVQLGKTHYFARSIAGSFAQEVARSMSMTRWLRAASWLFALGAVGTGVSVLAQLGAPNPVAEARAPVAPRDFYLNELPVYTVKPGPLKVSVVERGVLTAVNEQDLYSNVEGLSAIMNIKPEGSAVKQGELVCVLDSAALRDSLVTQAIATQRAQVAYANAKLVREAAEIALIEYTQGIAPLELNAVSTDIELAQKGMLLGEARAERARRAHRQLDETTHRSGAAKTPSDIAAKLEIDDRLEIAQQSFEREKKMLELAVARREILEKYTKPKKTEELKSDAEAKSSDELAKQAGWELAKARENILEKQIGYCQIRAPRDGLLVHARDPFRPIGPSRIEVGATVREHQKICSVIDPNGRMRVNALVHESKIALVTLRMRARIEVDAFPQRALVGSVVEIAPLPIPKNFFSGEENLYATAVQIDEALPGLRPGMSAVVEIFVDERENILSVPASAVVEFEGKHRVAVKRSAGVFESRAVTLGSSSGEIVEVKEGLHQDEQVYVNPRALLSDEQRRSSSPSPAASSAKRP
jgi:RNA polymerase sigma factor (sigma-70 family)